MACDERRRTSENGASLWSRSPEGGYVTSLVKYLRQRIRDILRLKEVIA